jgi:hypothetical protein
VSTLDDRCERSGANLENPSTTDVAESSRLDAGMGLVARPGDRLRVTKSTLPTFADECSRRLAPVKSWVSSRFGASSACHSSQTCRRRIPCRWQPPCRPPCRAVQRHRVRRARLPKVMARAAAAVGVVRVSGFDATCARWCLSIVPSSHGPPATLRERARSAYTRSVESCSTWACN